MSIDAMTDAAIRRLAPPPATPPARAMALEFGAAPATTAPAATPATPTAPDPRQSVTTYIPTEVLTLYVATVSGFQHDGPPQTRDAALFWVFLSLTPLVVWLTYAGKLNSAGKPLPAAPAHWPVWEMIAATAAYAAWAFALPNNPLARVINGTPALGSIAMLGVSMALALLTPLFQRRAR